MCGIVTMILKDQKKVFGHEYTDMFKQMLHANAVRGWDSTGIACIKQTGYVHIVKDALVPFDLFKTVPDNTWVFQNQAYIGHNRWATRGRTNADNAHPFQVENISLVHNGTLRFHMFLKNVEVDSHAITHAINEKGAIKTLEVLDGAYALVWHDQTTNNIYATRNDERPLFLLETEDLYLLSSERGLVYWICERFKVKVRKCSPITPGILYTFRANKKEQIIVEQTKYKMLDPIEDFLPPTHYRPPSSSTITPYIAPNNIAGFEIGQTITVTPTEGKDLGYVAFNHGTYRWICTDPNYPDYKFEVFSSNQEQNLIGELITAKVSHIYRNGNNPVIIAKLQGVVEKKTNDDVLTATISSINGILMTKAVREIAENCLCVLCAGPFEYRSDIVIFPLYRNNHLYKYTYYCPNCSHSFVPKTKLRALQ